MTNPDARVAAWIEAALERAADRTDACMVIVDEATQANLRWANNALTTNGQMHSRTGTVIAIADRDGGRCASVVQGMVADSEALGSLVDKAIAGLTDASPAEDGMPLVDGGVSEDWDRAADQTSIAVLEGFAAGLGRCFGRAAGRDLRASAGEARSHLLFGFAEHHLTTTWLGTSAGTRLRHTQPMGRVELNAKHTDMIGSAWVGRATVDFADIDAEALVDEVLERLSWSENRIDLPAGDYETILPPSAVADLMISAYWGMGARAAAEGRNAFSRKGKPGETRIGDRLSELPLTLASDPADAELRTTPFVVAHASAEGEQSVFDNGVATARTAWVDRGQLADLVRTRKVAADQGLEPRPATWNLRLDGDGTASLQDMIASTKRGLLLTCLWYMREVDPERLLMTGLTRDGVYLIEDGEVVGAVNNFRFNESPVELLGRVSEVSRAEPTLCREWNDYFTLTAMPAIRVPDFHMSTVSKAH
ncbi:metallopeptidase TldD-related protein [Mariniluteicoccus flavus]